MTAQHHSDVAVLLDQLCPHRIAIVVSPKAVILSVETIARRNAGIVEVLVSMRNDDDLLVRIALNHLRCPGEDAVTRIKFEGQDQIWLAVNVHDAIEVFVAACRKTADPIWRRPVGASVPAWSEVVVEALRSRGSTRWMVVVVIMISDGGEVRNMGGIEHFVSRVGGRPLS